MLADWLREWDRNRYRKSLQELREARRELREARKERVQAEKALQEARAEANHQWQARQQAALQAGIPFNEPPPFLTPNDTAPENPNDR